MTAINSFHLSEASVLLSRLHGATPLLLSGLAKTHKTCQHIQTQSNKPFLLNGLHTTTTLSAVPFEQYSLQHMPLESKKPATGRWSHRPLAHPCAFTSPAASPNYFLSACACLKLPQPPFRVAKPEEFLLVQLCNRPT